MHACSLVVGSSRGFVHHHTKDLVEVVLGHLLRHVQVHLLDSHANLLLASSVDGLSEVDATIRLQDFDFEKRRALASCFLFTAIRADHDAWAILQTFGSEEMMGGKRLQR